MIVTGNRGFRYNSIICNLSKIRLTNSYFQGLQQQTTRRFHSHEILTTSKTNTKMSFSSDEDPSKMKQNDNHNNRTPNFDLGRIRHELVQHWLNAEAKSPPRASRKGTAAAQYCCFTYNDGVRAYQQPSANWHWLDRELSSNMAGETGAVYIYKGAMFAMSMSPQKKRFSPQAYGFVQEHYQNELSHLQYFQSILSHGKYTRLLPLWRLAGWTLGFLPTFVGGSKALYVTVHAVESFVEEHYQDQIQPLKKQQEQEDNASATELLRLLEHCCEDEVHHKNDAKEKLLMMGRDDGNDDDDNASNNTASTERQLLDLWWVKPWSLTVRYGSIVAAEIARRV